MRPPNCSEDAYRRPATRTNSLNGTTKPRVRASSAPWLLQSYMQGEVDLNQELAVRFANMPHMSIFRAPVAGRSRFMTATLSSQDGAAALHIDLDTITQALECSFTLGSMLSLRFHIDGLSSLDREYWIEVMREGDGAPAFLWGETRWNADYLICSAHRYFTYIFAFSPLRVEAAVRLTPEVTRRLLDWLEGYWIPTTVEEPEEAPDGAFAW